MTPSSITVTIQSFGFRHHDDQPQGHGLLYDVRGLLPRLADAPDWRRLTGLDDPVSDAVRNSEGADELAERIVGETAALLAYACPRGRDTQVLIGGHDGLQRSVALAEWAAEVLRERLGPDGPIVEITHRHLTRSVVSS
jgi:RNase adaptor protein for sRNA GlmZ degradation